MADIKEGDSISVHMLVTKDLLPIPAHVEVIELKGDDYVLVVDDDGALQEVVQGRDMVLHSEAAAFVDWVGSKPFWMFDSNQNKFSRMQLKMVSNESAGTV